MKKVAAISAVLAIMLWTVSVQAYMVLDGYWGGSVVGASPTAYGDQISGSLHEFGVDQATINVGGGMVSVKLTGSYFPSHLGNIGLAGNYGPGDLYISTGGWNPSAGPTPFSTDTFDSTEGWNLVVSQSGKVFALDYDTINYSNASIGIFRADQAWIGGYGTELVNATVKLDASGMEFVFPQSVLGGAKNIGFHWTMGCGNDVFEGGTCVPVPSSILLLGGGLLCLICAGSRRKAGK